MLEFLPIHEAFIIMLEFVFPSLLLLLSETGAAAAAEAAGGADADKAG